MMPRITIPKKAGQFKIVATGKGCAVANGKIGRSSTILIPCKRYEQAAKICKQLNEKDHDGEIWT